MAQKLTVINTPAEDGNNAILFQMTGNFSIEKEADGKLAVIGENENATYYKHFVYLSDNITYAHIEIEAKKETAEAMSKVLKIAEG